MFEIFSCIYVVVLDVVDLLCVICSEFVFFQYNYCDQMYFVGNLLGLQLCGVCVVVQEVMDKWVSLVVEGYFIGDIQWLCYYCLVSEQLVCVVGVLFSEVVVMNILSVNFYLMMVSFYWFIVECFVIFIEVGVFFIDCYVVELQICFYGFDLVMDLVEVQFDEFNGIVLLQVIECVIVVYGFCFVFVFWFGVQYCSGQVFDLDVIICMVCLQGVCVGFDFVYLVGNVLLQFYDIVFDFVVWCYYKYFNVGLGVVVGCFVYECYYCDIILLCFVGWWGYEEVICFKMVFQFVLVVGVEGWQFSNFLVFGFVLLCVFFDVLDKVGGIDVMCIKLLCLIGMFDVFVCVCLFGVLQVLIFVEFECCGCQFFLCVIGGCECGCSLFEYLQIVGVFGDWCEFDVICILFILLYNCYFDLYYFVEEVEVWVGF